LAYVSRQLLTFDPDRAVRISLEKENTAITLNRQSPGDPWVHRDGEGAVDQETVDSTLQSLSSMYAESVLSYRPDFGTDQEARISIGLGGETPENLTLIISGSMIWVQGREVIYAVSEASLTQLLETFPQALSNVEKFPNAQEKRP
jgi:hypothetical protein